MMAFTLCAALGQYAVLAFAAANPIPELPPMTGTFFDVSISNVLLSN